MYQMWNYILTGRKYGGKMRIRESRIRRSSYIANKKTTNHINEYYLPIDGLRFLRFLRPNY